MSLPVTKGDNPFSAKIPVGEWVKILENVKNATIHFSIPSTSYIHYCKTGDPIPKDFDCVFLTCKGDFLVFEDNTERDVYIRSDRYVLDIVIGA
ncbi:MAG: hypothetical protein ACRCZB_05160 [Bacteroidales bacterium]